MSIFLDIFYYDDDDDDIFMWEFIEVSLGSMGSIFLEKKCGYVDDQEK